jgi:hypothetical protein
MNIKNIVPNMTIIMKWVEDVHEAYFPRNVILNTLSEH